MASTRSHTGLSGCRSREKEFVVAESCLLAASSIRCNRSRLGDSGNPGDCWCDGLLSPGIDSGRVSRP
jgi:hypothetical protein